MHEAKDVPVYGYFVWKRDVYRLEGFVCWPDSQDVKALEVRVVGKRNENGEFVPLSCASETTEFNPYQTVEPVTLMAVTETAGDAKQKED